MVAAVPLIGAEGGGAEALFGLDFVEDAAGVAADGPTLEGSEDLTELLSCQSIRGFGLGCFLGGLRDRVRCLSRWPRGGVRLRIRRFRVSLRGDRERDR